MNRKQFVFVLVALAFIGGAGLVLLNHNKESWNVREARMGDKVLPHFRFNDVAAIHLKGESDLNVVRKDALWRVRERGDYPANFHQISALLIKIRDLKVVQSETIGLSQLSRVDLAPPEGSVPTIDTRNKSSGIKEVSMVRTDPSHRGTLIEFMDGQGKVLDALLVGKKHARQSGENGMPVSLNGLFDGRYILLPGDPGNVLLISDELASVVSEPEAWLSRDFVKLENIQSISLVSTNPANSWSLSRETGSESWTLADSKPGESVDNRLASQIAEMLGFLSFVDVASTAATPAETGLNRPMVVTVLTFDHFAYTLKIGGKRPEGNYYLAVAVAADFPAERPATAGPANENSNDRESQDKTKNLRDKFAKEQAFAQSVYVADSRVIERLIRDRAEILEKKTVLSEQNAATNGIPLTITQ